MKRAAAFIASFLLAALPFGASAAGEQADAGSASEAARGKSIVVYFSASGNTRAAAEKIAELTGLRYRLPRISHLVGHRAQGPLELRREA